MSFKDYKTWVGPALGGAVAATYLLAVYGVVATGLIPGKYLVGILIVTALAVATVAYCDYRTKWISLWKNVLLVLISLVMVGSSLYAFSVGNSASSFLGSFADNSVAYQSYSIIAKTGSGVGVRVKNKTIGFISEDPNKAQVLKAVNGKTSASPKAYSELASLTAALDDKSVDSAVLNSAYLPILRSNYPTFYSSVHVLDSFKVRVRSASSTKTDITMPFVLYISGIDTYGDVDTVSRSDVNIMAVVNPKTHKILLVNTPRDYYVQLHGTTGVRDKLTHAGIYGVDMSKYTMEDLYGTNVNYTLRINFTSLLKIVDAIGGVNVYSDNDFTAGKYHFVKGYNQLDAKAALAFSRERHSFTDGDRQRGKDQQRVIEAIVAKMSNPANLVKYPSILKSVDGSFQSNASKGEISALIKQQANSLGTWQTESISVTGSDSHNSTFSMGNVQLYVMEPDVASVNAAKAKIAEYRQ